MYANGCLQMLYAVAAGVCTLLEVQHFQKLHMFYAALSTDFSTVVVENVVKPFRCSYGKLQKRGAALHGKCNVFVG